MDVMIDLETMGTGPDAAIGAVGAVVFDLTTGELGARFYRVVDLQSAIEGGGTIDGATVLWWMRQGDEARAALQVPGDPLRKVLAEFGAWLDGEAGEFKGRRLWGNGASFDCVVLSGAYRRLALEQPWPWWGERCYRTVRDLFPEVVIPRVGVHHHAIADAEHQAAHLVAILGHVPADVQKAGG